MVKHIKAVTQTVIDNIDTLKKVHELLLAMEAVFHHDNSEIYMLIDNLLNLPRSSSLTIECILWLLQTGSSDIARSLLPSEPENSDVAILEEVMFNMAFNMIQGNVSILTAGMKSDIGSSAISRVAALRQQQLPIEGGIRLLKLLVKTTNKMVDNENKSEASKISATKEQVDYFVESLKLLLEIGGWNHKALLFKLEA